jgi:hypothetical protein
MDDLTTIKGVGPVLAKQLETAGITSFEQLKAVDLRNPPFVLTGRVGWPYLVGEVAHFVAAKDGKGADAEDTPRTGVSSDDAAVGVGGGAASATDQAGDRKDGSGAEASEGSREDAAPRASAQEVDGGAGDHLGGESQAAAKAGGEAVATSSASITVTGPRRGRWRAGRHFGPVAVTIPLAELSESDLTAIENDPALTSTITE